METAVTPEPAAKRTEDDDGADPEAATKEEPPAKTAPPRSRRPGDVPNVAAGNSFDLDNATTLARERKLGKRKFVESWFIRRDASVCNTNPGPLLDVYGDMCDT
ncbi:hypothetical protein HPB47_017339 [Ixodes persulcatus]|uniref:Uncharacterized protein n=1 Tax=Ixodes persulcatus TaxID=34615 RepID=A0AC60QPG8_IXOPE|nr:hypothetical protein HPB47_017339 [Ixodes persulcatus]